MATDKDVENMKTSLQTAVQLIQQKLQEFRQPQTSTTDILRVDGVSSIDTITFSCSIADDKVMGNLTLEIQHLFNKNLAMLSEDYQKYILNLLFEYGYNRNEKQFKENLTIGSLPTFLNDLEALRDSIDAFKASWDGKLDDVKEFLTTYPTYKDKPGPWGTTLLYSAARNGHFELVKYLITDARCSVNAQNQQHLQRALSFETITAYDFKVDPKAGSTALHGACFAGYLDVVKYLVEHGANYFIKNQAEETPLENIELNIHVRKYFETVIIPGYAKQRKMLPRMPIVEGSNQSGEDCIWEYKPLLDNLWLPFDTEESKELSKSLVVEPGEKLQHEVHLSEHAAGYSVSTSQFLRSQQTTDEDKNLAWVRCRGSSIWNFDCYALWQMLFLEHPKSQPNNVMCLDVFDLQMMDDIEFQVQLNVWYNCDANTNSLLDENINNMKRFVRTSIKSISEDELTFDLLQFSFKNTRENIVGFIRWIPKLVSNIEQHGNQLSNIDNFQLLANSEPVPLTTRRLKQSLKTTKRNIPQEEQELASSDNECDDNYVSSENEHQNDDLDDSAEPQDKIDQLSGTHLLSLDTLQRDEDVETPLVGINDAENATDVSADHYFNENIITNGISQLPLPTKIPTSSEITETVKHQITQIEDEHKKVNDQLIQSDAKVANLYHLSDRMDEQRWLQTEQEIKQKHKEEMEKIEQNIYTMQEEIKMLNEKQKCLEQRQQTLKQSEQTIESREYSGFDSQIMYDFLIPKFNLLTSYITDSIPNMDEYFIGKIPKLIFKEINNATYTISVHGFPGHHTSFLAARDRIFKLSNSVKSAKEFYQRDINRVIRSITETFKMVQADTNIWKQYCKIFTRLLQEKSIEYVNRFNICLKEKSKLLIEGSILGISVPPWIELRAHTNDFLNDYPFIDEIENLKHQALDEFIKQNVSFQKLEFDGVPTKGSVNTVTELIKEIQLEFKTNAIYEGYQSDHFSLIPNLLERIMIYYSCFTVQLPLFESSRELLNKIENNTVTTIATSTGSGKSTLLPCLLIAEGYDKVIVTQPRRLPCRLISKRVNETIQVDTSDKGQKLAGWAVSGDQHNRSARILYLTDGLLKERLLYDENFITIHTQVDKSIVFFIDEVHERSVNIDLCLALLARLLTETPALESKLKIIISSATLDSSVPRLFDGISNVSFSEFKMKEMQTRYPVKKVARPKENILDIVLELYKKRERHDQILCFVNSVGQVNECCRLLTELSQGTIGAVALVQSQSPKTQQAYIETKSVFFSTTVAETSLTFPSLKYVVDTGMINVPVYDPELKRTVLREVRASESTIKQRLGRLGRTRPGEYYYLYDFDIKEQLYPIPHLLQSDLTIIEFSLRRSPIRNGLHYMQTYFPDKPTQVAMDTTVDDLRKLGILKAAPSKEFTEQGISLAKLPDFNSLAMSKSVLAALEQYNCGRDLICLASILSVLNTTNVLKRLPEDIKNSDGDFMTLLNIMNKALLVKQSVPSDKFDLDLFCKIKGVECIRHILQQALDRYKSLEKAFNSSNSYRQEIQIQSGNWERIAKSLLAGYSDNVFVSMKDLQERTHQYGRYNNITDLAVLDLQSTLIRPISEAPVSVVLARDVRYSTAVRSTAILSFIGEIKPSWVAVVTKREIAITDEEEKHLESKGIASRIKSMFSKFINVLFGHKTVSFNGKSGIIYKAELDLRKQIETTMKFELKNECKTGTAEYENLSRNLESITKMPYIFNAMKWRWEAQKQVKITIDPNSNTNTCEITLEGRDSANRSCQKEFQSFLSWLKRCTVIRPPNAGVLPRLLNPKMRKEYPDIEERIACITDSKRTMVDLYNSVKGQGATRESRMATVAWIAVCKFNCKLEGGFVRDWVIGHYVEPKNRQKNPKSWIQYYTNQNGQQIPTLIKEIVPSDLDCHLPLDRYFDIDKFRDELYKFGITCEIIREEWRYILLIDENVPTGPFTMDLIEPHVALTHDRIDLDVSNLSLEKDYPREIGMRIDITQSPYSIELETIVRNIKNKHFQVLRPVDTFVNDRVAKMINRQWKQVGEPSNYIPRPYAKYNAVLVPLPQTSTLFKAISTTLKTIANSVQIISIDEIKNPFLEDTYEAMKKIIGRECKGNPNEQKLYHGTKGDAINGIVEDGFDDRFSIRRGAWGTGAYFADNPKKSHDYTAAKSTNQVGIMFYNKVILGKESVMNQTNNELTAAPKGFHSVKGTGFAYNEYIVYRYAQALPYLKITYKV